MKKKEKQGLLILIGVAILVIAIIWFATRPKNETSNTPNGTSQSQAAQGEYTKVETDGTVVNTSEKVKETKEEEGFELTNTKIKEVNGKTTLSTQVTNKTGKQQETFIGNIVLLDKSGKEIGRIPVRISTLEAGESRDIEAKINESYANAYNFKLEK